MNNLTRAIQEFDQVQVFDISRHDSGPDLVLEAIDGRIRYVADGAPAWLREALGPTASGEQRDWWCHDALRSCRQGSQGQ